MRLLKGTSALCVLLLAGLLISLLALSAFADFSENAGGVDINVLDFTGSSLTTDSSRLKGMQLGGNIKYGALTSVTTLDGNEYYKFYVDDDNVGTTKTDPFGGFFFSNRNNSKLDGALKDYDYFTVDFDLTTEDEYVTNMCFFLCARNETGGLKQANTCLFKTVKKADGWYYSNSTGKKTVKAGDPFTWHHFTFVVAVDHSNGTNYSKTKTLVYIDGNYFDTYSNVLNDGAYYFDTVRWGVPTDKIYNHVSLCFDNVAIRGFGLGYTGPIASVPSGTPATLAGNQDTVYFSPYEVPIKPVAALNGKNYSSFDKAYAEAQALDTLTLYEDVDTEKVIDRELLIDKGSFAFSYSTDLTVTEFGENNTLLLFTDGAPTMKVTVKLLSDEYTSELTWGDEIELPAAFSETFAKDGLRYDFIDFTATDEKHYGTDLGEVTLARLHSDVTFTANYQNAPILFETVIGDVKTYYTDFSDFNAARLSKEAAVAFRFYTDYDAACGIYLPTGASASFDLNGNSFSSIGSVPLFILAQDSALTIENTAESEAVLSSESTLFYLYGDASVTVDSAKVSLISPTVADGVRSASSVTFKDCTVASSGANIESIRLDGGKLTMENVTLIGDAEIHLNGSEASGELKGVKSVSGLPKEALLVLTGGATATVSSSAVTGKFVTDGTFGAKIAEDCRLTTYTDEGFFADGSGLSERVKEMFMRSFSPRVRADIPENEKLNGKKKSEEMPSLDLD